MTADGRSVVFADREGNRRLDSLRNILSHARVGMLFLVPGMRETLRVNERATLVRDAPFLPRLALAGQDPEAGRPGRDRRVVPALRTLAHQGRPVGTGRLA
ncbi:MULTISPECIES: pyridoxamine 5'-phosphate oxidase family protein [Actinoalloteichus]|uniref:Pyridoxamine 5'-phosphate oxidase n=1 Tax=Actinoalloteichus fjordicus TaxID=1612552 RepID=A0AAC9LEY3_9PSEU|nr:MULTISPECIES: hypothetical protein [Actinoalloteichus]APU15624.1 Pyridoxamine 5'-phosphate oxidase [Actinoalloteichus fjordicus]APU21684.1 Pyridoxamine 5'-phosphate oxidase [Actinoalloteichus sp. GBA129-24]